MINNTKQMAHQKPYNYLISIKLQSNAMITMVTNNICVTAILYHLGDYQC